MFRLTRIATWDVKVLRQKCHLSIESICWDSGSSDLWWEPHPAQPGQGDINSATDSAVQVTHSDFWPSHYLLQPAHKPPQLEHGGQEGSKGGQRLDCAGRGGSSCGPHLDPAWLGHRPGPCSNLAKRQRCMVSTHRDMYTAAKGTCLQLTTSASVTALHCCAHLPGLTASLTTARWRERAGEVSWVEGMCSQSFSLLPIHQTSKSASHSAADRTQPFSKTCQDFHVKKPQTTNPLQTQAKTRKNPPPMALFCISRNGTAHHERSCWHIL